MSAPRTPLANETSDWHRLYRSDAAIARRLKTLPGRLQKLGVESLPRSARVLDLCCGEGETLGVLAEMGFTELLGVDLEISPSLAQDRRFKLTQGDAASTTLPPESVDWVSCLHSLHHLRDSAHVDGLIREAFRVLRPGGRLGIVDFHDSMSSRLALGLFKTGLPRFTSYLRYMSDLVREEWPYLSRYFAEWPRIRRVLFESGHRIVHHERDLFYFYLVVEKP